MVIFFVTYDFIFSSIIIVNKFLQKPVLNIYLFICSKRKSSYYIRKALLLLNFKKLFYFNLRLNSI